MKIRIGFQEEKEALNLILKTNYNEQKNIKTTYPFYFIIYSK